MSFYFRIELNFMEGKDDRKIIEGCKNGTKRGRNINNRSSSRILLFMYCSNRADEYLWIKMIVE